MFISCSNSGDNPAKKLLSLVFLSGQDSAEIQKSSVARNTSPAATQEELQQLTDGNTRFALDVYHAAAADNDNIFFSPHSISVALAMAFAGARGETGQEMASAMRFTLESGRLHNAFNDLDLRLNADAGDGMALSVVNAAWCQKGFPFESGYLDLLAENYGSGVYLQDFRTDPEGSRNRINRWVSNETHNRINDLIPQGTIDNLTRLVLTNAIYLKAEWLSTFDASSTHKGAFRGISGDSTADMMSQTKEFPYYDGEGFAALELPYKGNKFSMIVILPDEGNFTAIEASLDSTRVKDITSNLAETRVDLTMPKFSFTRDLSLGNIMKSLGMNIAFTPYADFSGITTADELFIGAILHKAFVAVDEMGTEAAAATAVVFGTTSFSPGVEMKIDRPFIFIIIHKQTSEILFMGRVINI